MSALHVFGREARAMVLSPQMYGIGAAYLVLSGVFFINILITSQVPDLAGYYANIANTLLVLVPVIAMRSFAEERRTGALDMQLAWPVGSTSLVFGKFLANTLYLWILSSNVWLYYRLVGHVADIQVGRTAGGYIGVLLMAMAFSALALMVSARASSPAAAAFLAFGLLLFLWVLDFAPGWIGDWLAALGPSEHFESFSKGVIYWEDVAYFVLVSFVGLGLAVAALERDRPGRALRSRLRHGAVLGAVLACSMSTVALAGEIRGQVDLTSAKQHTITPTTRDAIDKIKALGEPIRVTGFAAPLSGDATQLQDLAKQYRAAGAAITLKLIDPDLQPGRARRAGVSGYGEAVVSVGSRREVLTDASQGSFTNVLLRLSRPTKPGLCFTLGHGEHATTDQSAGGASTLAGALRYLGYEIKPIALAAPGAEAEMQGCAAVVIAGPTFPFLPRELALLGDYSAHNGRLLVMADAFSHEAREQMNELLLPWGLRIGGTVVTDESALADDPSSVAALDYGSGTSPPVARLQQHGVPVVLTSVLPVEPVGGAQGESAFVELVRSSPESWVMDGREKRRGPFVLAALADWSRLEGPPGQEVIARTRIGVVGTAELASNRSIDVLGNRDFTTALVQWIAHEDDVVAAGRPPGGFTKVLLTTDQKNRLVRHGIVLPTLALLVPVPATVLRLRRG